MLIAGVVVRLWTIQHEAVLPLLRKQGSFRADGRRVFHAFRRSYAWLRGQFCQRVADTEGRALIWAWQTSEPDLRETGHLHPGTPGVRIELEIPEARVLLSDFDGWNVVLTGDYLPASPEDARRRGQATQEEVEASWKRCFDLPRMQRLFLHPDWIGPDHQQQIQAVMEYFTLREVVRVTRFTAR